MEKQIENEKMEKWSIKFKDKKDNHYHFVIYHNLEDFGINIIDIFREWDRKRNNYNIDDFVLYCKMSAAGAYVFPEGGISDLEKSLMEKIQERLEQQENEVGEIV